MVTRTTTAQRALALSAVLVALVLATSGRARAEAPAGIGPAGSHISDRGRIMVGGELSGYWAHEPGTDPWDRFPHWAVDLAPNAMYFMRDRIGLGLLAGYGVSENALRYSRTTYDQHAQYLSFGPQATYDLRLSKTVSLMPLARALWVREWDVWRVVRTREGPPGVTLESETETYPHRADYLRWVLLVPLVFHVAHGVSFGLGPTLWFDVFIRRDPEPRSSAPLRDLYGDGIRFDAEQRVRAQLGGSTWIGVSF